MCTCTSVDASRVRLRASGTSCNMSRTPTTHYGATRSRGGNSRRLALSASKPNSFAYRRQSYPAVRENCYPEQRPYQPHKRLFDRESALDAVTEFSDAEFSPLRESNSYVNRENQDPAATHLAHFDLGLNVGHSCSDSQGHRMNMADVVVMLQEQQELIRKS